MPNQLDITTDQRDASDRHNLREAIYLLSGTFKGRRNVPDATFYWSTREVTAFGQTFEPYLGPPKQVRRSMGFEPGAASSTPEVDVPVRNLPFAHSESLVAALTDDDFSLENTELSLRVAYVRPGQDPNTFADADWTPLVLDGFAGPARDVRLDGAILPVYSRGAKRNSLMRWPRIASLDAARIGAIDRKDAGRSAPIVMGRPDGWFKPPVWNCGVRGFTVSGYAAGTTEVQFRAMTGGNEDLSSGNAPATGSNSQGIDAVGSTGFAGLMVHYRTPVYNVTAATFDPESQIYTVTLNSGLAGSVPRGGYVQQFGPGLRTSGALFPGNEDAESWDEYHWILAAHGYGSNLGLSLQAGWLFQDGQIRPADSVNWNFANVGNARLVTPEDVDCKTMGDWETSAASMLQWSLIELSRGTREDPRVPVYYDPGDPNVVKTQPEFTTTTLATSKLNYPTGGTGTDNDMARDGSTDTFVTLGVGAFITLTFNDAPSPFDNDDTVGSVLHVVTQGNINFEDNSGVITFGQATGTGGVNREFRFTQATARNFNTTVRCEGAGGSGGSVVEVWWEHDLSAEVTNSRTQDVEIGGQSVSGTVGEPLLYADLVVRFPPRKDGSMEGRAPSGTAASPFPDGATPWQVTEDLPEKFTIGPFDTTRIAYPTSVMAGLHMLLGARHEAGPINTASYNAAHQRYVDKNTRLNFVMDEPSSWTDLERLVGEQSRAHWFYGPSGHEVVFMEDASGIENMSPTQSFRLPGCPGANTFASQAPLLERTPTSELVNQVEVKWAPNPLDQNLERRIVAVNADSVADIGTVQRPQGAYQFTLHSPFEENPLYSGEESVSGIAQFYADRMAFASTRFRFDTAWVAHGLDRGSIIRIAYPVSTTPDSFRNVLCEVEEITASPINTDRFSLQARSLGLPQKGLDPNFTWADVFEDDPDTWDSKILQDFDAWENYWSIP